MSIPHLVAHRGYARKYPENTIAALQAAIDSGAHFLEIDVQMTSDHVPILMHDDDLLRTTGVAMQVMRSPWSSMLHLHAGECERLGNTFADEPIPTLADVVALLQRNPRVKAFVEVKTESIHFFGQHLVIKTVVDTLTPVAAQCAVISYDLAALIEARNLGCKEIGWILTYYNDEEENRSRAYRPDYLICNYKKIKLPIWQGNWQWFLYEITDPILALEWAARGVNYVETMYIAEMVNDPRLRG